MVGLREPSYLAQHCLELRMKDDLKVSNYSVSRCSDPRCLVLKTMDYSKEFYLAEMMMADYSARMMTVDLKVHNYLAPRCLELTKKDYSKEHYSATMMKVDLLVEHYLALLSERHHSYLVLNIISLRKSEIKTTYLILKYYGNNSYELYFKK